MRSPAAPDHGAIDCLYGDPARAINHRSAPGGKLVWIVALGMAFIAPATAAMPPDRAQPPLTAQT
ncbi:MAG: hypothetical protein C0474_10745, partial [Sphingobium sp.]|nr:hypothetical protein [Sphingobium sp.]